MFLTLIKTTLERKIILWDEAKNCGDKEFDINLCENNKKDKEKTDEK